MGGLMTTREVSDLLNVHMTTVRRWARSGKIKSYRVSSRGDRRFWETDVNKFLGKKK